MKISSVNFNPNFKATFRYKDKQINQFHVSDSKVTSPENRGNKNTDIYLHKIYSEENRSSRVPQSYSHKATFDIYNPFFGLQEFTKVPYIASTFGSLEDKPVEKLEWTFDEFTKQTEQLENQAVRQALMDGVQASVIEGGMPKMPMEILEKMINDKKPIENYGFTKQRLSEFRQVAIDLTFEIINNALNNMS